MRQPCRADFDASAQSVGTASQPAPGNDLRSCPMGCPQRCPRAAGTTWKRRPAHRRGKEPGGASGQPASESRSPKLRPRARRLGLEAALLTSGQTRRAVGAGWPCPQGAPRDTRVFAQKFPTMSQFCLSLRNGRSGQHAVRRGSRPSRPPLRPTPPPGLHDRDDDVPGAACWQLGHVDGRPQRVAQRQAPLQIRGGGGRVAP